MHELIARLYPICRSITGDGVRETLRILQKEIPLEMHEVATGTPVFDWTVPKEWNIRDAWIKNSAGEKLIDFQALNLHVVSYSCPVRTRMPFAELKRHLFTVPGFPDLVPYRTTYYHEDWGFCLTEKQLDQFSNEEEYEVWIDSSLEDGSLTYGELFLRGIESEEVLVSCHICHPSLADDNLSGISLAVALARHVEAAAHRYSYRFLFVPGTIGSITWLAHNEEVVPLVRHGLVLTCVGDGSEIIYKRSRRGDAEIDRAFAHVLKHSGDRFRVMDFSPYGYDERQYCSPGFDLPVGCLMRSQHGTFPEYHTSADNLDFVRADALEDSFVKCVAVLDLLESNGTFLSRNPKCEPQLGRRGLYEGAKAGDKGRTRDLALLWVLNLSDGENSLLQVAERAGLPFTVIRDAAKDLIGANLLTEK